MTRNTFFGLSTLLFLGCTEPYSSPPDGTASGGVSGTGAAPSNGGTPGSSSGGAQQTGGGGFGMGGQNSGGTAGGFQTGGGGPGGGGPGGGGPGGGGGRGGAAGGSGPGGGGGQGGGSGGGMSVNGGSGGNMPTGGNDPGGGSGGSGAQPSTGGDGGGMSATGGSGGSEPEIPPHTIPQDPCAPRNNYRNLFAELLGKTNAEVQQKLDAAFEHLFYGGNDARIYYPVGNDGAYILDVNNNDVRSEGMSYGMMAAVQMDKQDEFDRLWTWAKAVMRQPNGLFGWKATSGGQLLDSGPAPDGEEYFATALIFASRRWGSGKHDYAGDARAVLNAMRTGGVFNGNPPVIKFVPSANYSDPSYVLPAFYQVWACFDTANRSYWENVLRYARSFLHNATHPQTGLAPYLSNYDGSPHPNGPDFNSDSWRVVGNIMMDYHYYQADDPWQAQFAERYANFFKQAGPNSAEFTLSGNALATYANPVKGLVAQNAFVAFAVPAISEDLAVPFLEQLWNTEPPTGQYRYYDGMLYIFGLLHVSGNYRLEW